MPMSPRLLRPIASGIGFPIAEARDGSNNVIAATDYTDANGQAWRAHIFTQSGTLNFTRGGQVEYLVVAGGGGGGRWYGGGGGAGGLLQGQALFGSESLSVTVGAGGSGATVQLGGDGSASSLGTISTVGGGGGGGWYVAGRDGGSGGGGCNNVAGKGTAGQGNDGGRQGGGGGGGAGGAGVTAGSATANNVAGGTGIVSSITGSPVTYASGGTGSQSSSVAASGAANTGRGGNATFDNATNARGGNGGSGIVVVRYRYQDSFVPTQPWDSDALAYIEAVQIADGNFILETGVRDAINTFIVGCKADGIWSAIKASCILMGARTLSGALTPLVGAAPTNVNFVSGDYNRKTGLLGDGSTKHINSNRKNNADPQDSQHFVAYLSAIPTSIGVLIGAGGGGTGASSVQRSGDSTAGSRSRNSTYTGSGTNSAAWTAGLWGKSRTGSSTLTIRIANTVNILPSPFSVASQTPSSDDIFVFARNNGSGAAEVRASVRMAYYSIGEGLNLDTLGARLTTLYNAIGAAIP